MVRRRRPPLQRMFGVFKCPCHKDATWSSAHVYCIRGTFKVYFKQQCQRCGEARNPYSVNYLRCSICEELVPDCECSRGYDDEYNSGNQSGPPHRSDLCLKCKAGRPCTQRR